MMTSPNPICLNIFILFHLLGAWISGMNRLEQHSGSVSDIHIGL